MSHSPYIWIRRWIFGSLGCGAEYPQNSTSGLHVSFITHKEDFAHSFMMIHLKALPRVWSSCHRQNVQAE